MGRLQHTNELAWNCVTFKTNLVLKNKLERYAYFLELYIYFYEYNKMSEKERQELVKRSEQSNEDRRINIGKNKKLLNQNIYVIPDCRFYCGTAPCGCEEYWQEFQELAKEFGTFVDKTKHIINKTSLNKLLDEMDEEENKKNIISKIISYIKGK